MDINHSSLKSLEDVLTVSQKYMNIFDILDIKHQGYLDENQAQIYLTSIDFGKEYHIIHDAIPDIKESDRLIMKQFVLIMFLAQYRHKDINVEKVDYNSYLTEFSDCLRHCEEAIQAIEHYKFFSLVTLAELKTKFSQAFSKLEYILKQIVITDIQQKREFNFSHGKQGIPSPPHEKVMPGSFENDDPVKNLEREVSAAGSINKISAPQSNPGFLGQSHQEASTLTLRSQASPSPEPYSKKDSDEAHDDITSDTNPQKHQEKESGDTNYSYDSHLVADAISNITASVTGIASLVGLTNSPKGETRGLDVVPETNQDIVQPTETTKDVTPLPIKPDNVDDSIPIDAPIDSKIRDNNNNNEHQNLTKEEINQGADALKEMAQSIPVTNTPDSPSSSKLPDPVYDAKRLAKALDEKTALEIQVINEKKNRDASDTNPISSALDSVKPVMNEKSNRDAYDKNPVSSAFDSVKSVMNENNYTSASDKNLISSALDSVKPAANEKNNTDASDKNPISSAFDSVKSVMNEKTDTGTSDKNPISSALDSVKSVMNEKTNTDTSDKNPISSAIDSIKSVINDPISKDAKPLDAGTSTDLDSLNDHMDEAMNNDRPGPMKNKESFGEAIIIVPVQDDSEDKRHFSSLDHNGRIKEHPDDFYDKQDTVSDSSFKSGDGNTRAIPTDTTTTTTGTSDAQQSDQIKKLERDIEEQLDIMSTSPSSQSGISESSSHKPERTSHLNPAQLQSPFFHDKSTAEVIENLTRRSSHIDKNSKRASMMGGDGVLYVRHGFENFAGIGVKCLSKDKPSSI